MQSARHSDAAGPANIEVTVAWENGVPSFDPAPLVRAVHVALDLHPCPAARLHIALVGDARIAELNLRFLGHEGPTDVLSFDMRDSGSQAIEGEIVVSCETAIREAAARSKSVDHEAALYAVHGTLHLLGYDDGSPEQASTMRRLQDEILRRAGMKSDPEERPPTQASCN